MYRRNLENTATLPFQTVQFSTFRRKNEAYIQLERQQCKQNEFQISNMTNAPLFLASIASLILMGQKTQKKLKKSNFFSDFIIENIPKQFSNVQHEKTLQQLLLIFQQHCKSIEELQQILIEYPISQFIIKCFGRCSIYKYIEEKNPESMQEIKSNKSTPVSAHFLNSSGHSQNTDFTSFGNIPHSHFTELDLLGNQKQVIEDYNTEIRGNLLEYLCNALRIQMNIIFQGINDEQITQHYGDKANQIKLGITQNDKGYLCELMHEKIVPKLSSAHSSHHINQHMIAGSRKKQQIDSTTEGLSDKTKAESKSVNKDHMGKCRFCGSKARFCECDRKMGATPKQQLKQPKSIFDSLNFGGGGGALSRTNRNEDNINKKTCFCNRNICICNRK